MLKKDKIERTKQLKDIVENCRNFVFTDYRGLKVSEITELRTDLRKNNAICKVVKNRLFKRVLDDFEIKIEDEELFALPKVADCL